jgi:hypothetical protein
MSNRAREWYTTRRSTWALALTHNLTLRSTWALAIPEFIRYNGARILDTEVLAIDRLAPASTNQSRQLDPLCRSTPHTERRPKKYLFVFFFRSSNRSKSTLAVSLKKRSPSVNLGVSPMVGHPRVDHGAARGINLVR